MIGRRTFVIGLGSALLARPAAALVRANGRAWPGDPRKLKDLPETPLEQIPNHRQFMRDIVVELSAYAKGRDSRFALLARDAPELLVKESREAEWETVQDPDGAAAGKYSPVGSIVRPYLKAVDGLLVDGLFYGADGFDQPSTGGTVTMQAVQAAQKEGRRVLTLEYCKTKANVSDAYRQAAKARTLSWVDQSGNPRPGRVPSGRPAAENPEHVTNLQQARNFLPLLRSEGFGGRDAMVAALAGTNYDLLLVDPFWRGADPLSAADLKLLKRKQVGTQRLVFANLPVGRAIDTGYYWKREWRVGNPPWLEAPDPETPSQTVIRYWDPAWKEQLGNYLKAVMDTGYDGVLLDYLDVYTYFEEMMPLR